MGDLEFSEAVTSFIPQSASILVLSDCCSGTVADFQQDCWDGFDAISISSCLDTKGPGDVGKTGALTQAVLLAIDNISKQGEQDYSVARVFNMTVGTDKHCLQGAQRIT